MPNEENFFKETKEKVNSYIKQNILLLRLQATEKASKIISGVITAILVVIVGLFLLIFASVTAGIWLGHVTGSMIAGFGIVALFYFLLLLIVIFVLRNAFRNYFINKLIRFFHKKN